MTARELVTAWVGTFNRADADTLAAFYSDDAVNHQVTESPIKGKDAICKMFADGFVGANMVCLIENIFEGGE